MALLEDFNEIDKILKKDARTMKSAGRGVFSRASRKGFIRGGMKTPYDFMSTKEKKKLNGEVKIYMLHQQNIENVKSLDEIMKMEPQARLKYFGEVMEAYTVRVLCKHWGLSSSTLYSKYIPEIGYEKNTETSAKKAGRKRKDTTQGTNENKKTTKSKSNKKDKTIDTIDTTEISQSNLENNIEILDKIEQNTIVQDDKTINNYSNNSSHTFSNQEFNFKGQYDSSRLDAIYNKLRILLDSGILYDVEINIKETEKQA